MRSVGSSFQPACHQVSATTATALSSTGTIARTPGILAPGETAVATTNRNFSGRMGSPEANVYLANAYVAAAAAVAGEIVHPQVAELAASADEEAD